MACKRREAYKNQVSISPNTYEKLCTKVINFQIFYFYIFPVTIFEEGNWLKIALKLIARTTTGLFKQVMGHKEEEIAKGPLLKSVF